MIRITDVHKTYRMGDTDVHALNGVSLTIQPGDFVAIMGPSGSGKSTLMHVLGLLDVPDSGSYQLLGREVSKLGQDELAALRSVQIGFVFQQFNLLSRTTAIENVSLPARYAGGELSEAWPKELLTRVGLGERLDHKPNQLSGGQQQRVAIARSLVNRPSILFADEPTGNLDSTSEKEIMALLEKLNAEGITVILVTHEPEIALHAKRVIRMRDGQVVSDEVRVPTATTVPKTSTLPASLNRGRISLVKDALGHIKQAARSLASNKIRTSLSMLGVMIGVAAVVAMLALGTGAQKSIEESLASLGSNLLVLRPGSARAGGVSLGAGAATRLTLDDAKDIATLPTVARVNPSISDRGQASYINKNWSTRIEGVSPAYAPMRASVPILGRFFTETEAAQRARVAVIGQTVARELFGDKRPIGETMKINRISFQVIGVLPKKGGGGWRDEDDVIVIPVQTAMRRVSGKNYVESIDIESRDADSLTTTEESTIALMRKRQRIPAGREDGFQIRNMAEIQATLSQTSRTMSLLLACIAAISLLVGGIGIMNIMLVSVTERTREIGLRKAIGARKKDILTQFLVEAILVSATGGLIGILLGWMVVKALATFAGWAASVSPQAVFLSFFFSAGIGILFGLWPARKASSLNPIDALRWE